ncbi:MAG: hypothetical protein ABJO09_01290 [Hyphomicrobiales bacterium]
MRFQIVIIGLVFTLLAALNDLTQAKETKAQTHSFGGLVAVEQKKESLSNLVMGLWGSITIEESGAVHGDGIVRYEGVVPCSWTPPDPESGPAPHCKLENLIDGRFTVKGRVAEEEQTKYYLKELSEQIVGHNEKTADEIIENSPTVLALELALSENPKELIEFWGLDGGATAKRETHVATGGLLISTLFYQEFLIALKPSDPYAPSRYEFEGYFEGDWPITSAGAVYFPDLPLEKLPTETDHQVFINGGVKPISEDMDEFKPLNFDALIPWRGGLYSKY